MEMVRVGVIQDQIVPSPLTADQMHREWEIPVRGRY